MANRRMFSKTITRSSKFLRMSSATRLLYYELGMDADDDGFVEWYAVITMTRAAEQDLQVLQANGFVQIFDDKVLLVSDWKENNYLRSDRYTPSKYLTIYAKEIGVPVVYQLATDGIPLVDERYPQDRLGKVREGKDIPPSLRSGVEGVGDIPMSKETRDIWDYWEETMAPITRNKTFQRNALVGLIRNHGMDDVKKMIRVAAAALSAEYVPAKFKADSPKQLEERWDSLVLWARSEGSKQHKQSQIHSTVVR